MVSRRNKPFRKQPPSRRPGQVRRAPARWETVLEDEGDREYEDFDDVEEEGDGPDVRQAAPVRVPVPAPRTAEHDVLEPEPLDEAPLEEPVVDQAHDDDPGDRGPGRKVLAYGAIGLVLVTVVGIVLLLTGSGDGTESRDDLPVAFDPPVALPAGREYVRTRVLASGTLQVDHWIRSTRRLSRLDLSVPTVPGVEPGTLAVRRLDVRADGRDLGVPRTLRLGQGYSLGGSREVHVSYQLTGATERSGPGQRALTRVTSLDLSYDPGPTSRTQVVTGATVLALACSAPEATPAPCGEPTDGRWSVELTGERRTDQVMAQVDLSSAGT